MERPQMTALAIYQQGLDAVSGAVLDGDFARFRALVDLPYLVRTETGDDLLRTPEELERMFRSVSRALAARGVTHYIRIAREAVFSRPDRVEGRHFVHLLTGDQRLVRPWASRQAMVRREDRWRFTEAQFPLRAAADEIDEDTLFADDKDDACLARALAPFASPRFTGSRQ